MNSKLYEKALRKAGKQSSLLIGKPITFESAFESVESIRIEFREYGDGIREWIMGDTPTLQCITDKKSIGEDISCNNPFCSNGGFEIGDKLFEMILDGDTERSLYVFCHGHIGKIKKYETPRQCNHRIEGRIIIKYKS